MITKFCKFEQKHGKLSHVSILIGFLLIFISTTVNAQFQTFEWARYGEGSGKERGHFVDSDDNSNVYVVGSYEITTDFDPGAGIANLTAQGAGDIFITKSDQDGNFLWAKSLASVKYDQVTAMVVDPAGNIYLAVLFDDILDVDPGVGVVQFGSMGTNSSRVLLKLNTNGVFVWAKEIGNGASIFRVSALDIDNSGNVIVAGYFDGSVDINFDAGVLTFSVLLGSSADTYIMEVSSSGVFTWAKQLCSTTTGSTYNGPSAITIDSNDNIIITGYLRGTTDLDPGSGVDLLDTGGDYGVYIAKYSSTGIYIWGGGITHNNIVKTTDIKTDINGNVIVSLYSMGGNIDFDITAGIYLMSTWPNAPCLLKLSSSGSFLWSKTFISSGWSGNINLEVSQGSAAYVIMTSEFKATQDVDPNSGVVNVTSTPPLYGPGVYDDALVLKLSSNGDYLAHTLITGKKKEQISDITLGPNAKLFITGYFLGQVDFDGSATTSIKTSLGSEDIFSLRLNMSLDHIWSHSIGSNGLHSQNAVSKHISTSILSGGSVNGSASNTIELGFQNKNARLSSTYESSGSSFNYIFGGPGNDEVTTLFRDAQGNSYVAGTFEQVANMQITFTEPDMFLTSAGAKDIFIMKINSSSRVTWVKRIGGTYDEEIEALTVHGNSIYLTGAYKGTVDFNPNAGTFNMVSNGNTFDIFVMKLDTSGAFGWAKSIGSSTAYDSGRGIATDPSGNVLITGYYSGAADFDPNSGVFNMTSIAIADIFILKLNSAGNLLWAKSIGSSSSSDDVGTDIVSDNAGNVYHTGYFKYTADFDPGPGVYNLSTTGGSTNNDGYIQKLDPNGNHLWTGHLKGTGNDRPEAITIDILNNVYVTGSFSGTIDMDPFISRTQNLTATGGTDGFMLSLRVADSTCWFYKIGGATNDNATGIAVDSAFNVYTIGNFSGTVDFDPLPSTFEITANGSPMDSYIFKLGQVSPLPVELLSFTATPEDNQYISCEWTTASEQDNDYFTIERSKNGIDFETAGIIDGAGNSSSTLSYSFTDKEPYRGLSYYRLKQTDYNGNSSLSEVVAVMLTEKNNVLGFPNPATDQFTLYFDPEISYHLTVIDLNGRIVFEKEAVSSGYSINTADFSSGMYHVKITNNLNDPIYLKMVVRH